MYILSLPEKMDDSSQPKNTNLVMSNCNNLLNILQTLASIAAIMALIGSFTISAFCITTLILPAINESTYPAWPYLDMACLVISSVLNVVMVYLSFALATVITVRRWKVQEASRWCMGVANLKVITGWLIFFWVYWALQLVCTSIAELDSSFFILNRSFFGVVWFLLWLAVHGYMAKLRHERPTLFK